MIIILAETPPTDVIIFVGVFSGTLVFGGIWLLVSWVWATWSDAVEFKKLYNEFVDRYRSSESLASKYKDYADEFRAERDDLQVSFNKVLKSRLKAQRRNVRVTDLEARLLSLGSELSIANDRLAAVQAVLQGEYNVDE